MSLSVPVGQRPADSETASPTLADVLLAIEGIRGEVELLRRQLDHPRGGAPVGMGLRRDDIVRKVAELYIAETDTWPTQETTAEKLDRDPSRVKQLQGRRGWAGIRADARRLLDRQL